MNYSLGFSVLSISVVLWLLPIPASALPCVWPKLFPEIQWMTLKAGTRLGADDALLICEGSSVEIKATHRLEIPVPWSSAENGYRAVLLPESLARIVSTEGKVEALEVVALEISGTAYYSTDRTKMQHLRVPTIQTLTGNAARQFFETYQRQRNERLRDLRGMEWMPLTTERQLNPWDMIWTKQNGRVEIEILEMGKAYFVDGETAVIGPQGNPTHKKRFPANSFLIMAPEFYMKAKVNKVVGEVLIATNQGKVKEFFERYHALSLPGEEITERRWQEALKKPELE